MAAVDALLEAVQAAADARYARSIEAGGPVMVALGTPGTTVEIATQKLPSGRAWGDDKTMQVLLTGIEAWLSTQGVGQIGAAVDKLNELVTAYNQLRADYNASVVPTTAPAVLPLS